MSRTNQFKHLKIKLEAIQSATNNFSADNCIGHGGFGKVYKGELTHESGESMVAFKRLDPAFGQGNSEFWKEIMMLSYYRHENIVSLLGYCDDHGEKILVYEYASKKSLDSYLSNDDLTWVQRLKICVGASRGLAYLHTPADTKLRILHRDIKSSNILLDGNWNAKISDFGLAKFAPANSQFTFLISNPAGTPVYIDPEYQETGLLTKESDVYSFGVVLFEVLCGRLCFGEKNLRPLIGIVREYYLESKISDLVYSNIRDGINRSSLNLYVDLAYKCINRNPGERPLMTEIVSTLEKAFDIQVRGAYTRKDTVARGTGILHMKVIGTTDDGSIPFHDSNHYMVLNVHSGYPVENTRTNTLNVNEVNALWIQEFTVRMKPVRSQSLDLAIYKVSVMNTVYPIWLQQFTFILEQPPTDEKLHLEVINDSWTRLIPGKVKVREDTTVYESGILYMKVIGTTDDGSEPFDASNHYMVLSVAGDDPLENIRMTTLKVNEVNAVWNEEFALRDLMRSQFLELTINKVSVKNTHFPIRLQEFTFILEQPSTDENLHLEVVYNSRMGLIPGKGSFGCVDISLALLVLLTRNGPTSSTHLNEKGSTGFTITNEVLITVSISSKWSCNGGPNDDGKIVTNS
ncbi:hypothetical protein SSX86_013085 [Deinandra increscens subsp. villosa]|uniref:non-specific serine/threonine protein kinase n=1 Tax=Deinandra increscens subsp. villosa TaxID=3103831 RepID=A0AAP0H1G8_9ASTR